LSSTNARRDKNRGIEANLEYQVQNLGRTRRVSSDEPSTAVNIEFHCSLVSHFQ
jgi:hypothetical protein